MSKAVGTHDGFVPVASSSYRSNSETNAIFTGGIKVWLTDCVLLTGRPVIYGIYSNLG